MEIKEILEGIREGSLSVEEGERLLKGSAYDEMGFAKVDAGRKARTGRGEVIYCPGKADSHLLSIFEKIYSEEGEVLGTRANTHQYEIIAERFPQVKYNSLSGIIKIEKPKELIGLVAVCSGGTADVPVAEEAAETAEFFGSRVVRVYDVGVCGIHRLLNRLDTIRKANCIIAVAGMEGALAGVLGGLVDKPVIAVPTSVGYGANFGGLSALLTMINSCSNGIAVTNIDNGYGAGYIASQINELGARRS